MLRVTDVCFSIDLYTAFDEDKSTRNERLSQTEISTLANFSERTQMKVSNQRDGNKTRQDIQYTIRYQHIKIDTPRKLEIQMRVYRFCFGCGGAPNNIRQVFGSPSLSMGASCVLCIVCAFTFTHNIYRCCC